MLKMLVFSSRRNLQCGDRDAECWECLRWLRCSLGESADVELEMLDEMLGVIPRDVGELFSRRITDVVTSEC
jgi:hypothetical protein